MIEDWQKQWNIPDAAIRDLMKRLGAHEVPQRCPDGDMEQDVQQRVRLEASSKGHVLWRNNSGVTERHVRYGLCNDSPKVNRRLKSSDLVGIESRIVTPQMVGRRVGIFLAREMKKPGWCFQGKGTRKNEEEMAQLRWLMIVYGMGGNAAFCDTVGTL